MCIPMPQAQAAPASPIPSMQAANDLVLPGDAGHGAAQVGRLQLRAFAGFNTPASSAASAAPSPAAPPVAPAAAAPSTAASPTGTSSAASLGVPMTAADRTLSPNLGLRLGAAP